MAYGDCWRVAASRSTESISCRIRRRQHFDAIHRTRGNAQFTAGAKRLDDNVHEPGAADDGVNRTGLGALGAADAVGFDHRGDDGGSVFATFAVVWLCGHTEQMCQGMGAVVAAWWTTVDVRQAFGYRFGIGAASGKTALAALCLR
jgi:hypothetical protein